MIRTGLLILLLAVVGCDIGVRNRPELRWIGPVTPTADAAQCPASRGVLVLRDGEVLFAPDEGTWVLNGSAGPATLEASQSRITPDHKAYDTKLQARWTDSAVQGTYTTPRCTYHVALSRS